MWVFCRETTQESLIETLNKVQFHFLLGVLNARTYPTLIATVSDGRERALACLEIDGSGRFSEAVLPVCC